MGELQRRFDTRNAGIEFLSWVEKIQIDMNLTPHIAVSEREYRIHRCPRWLRPFRRLEYPRNLHSGQPITEFVALADRCAALDLPVIPQTETEDHLKQDIPVLRFGAADPAEDLRLLDRYPHAPGEWNRRNIETVQNFNHYLDLGRETWDLYLSAPSHREKLADLFRQHGRLFIKSRTKGHAHVYTSLAECLTVFGDVSRLMEETLDVVVSEVMDIRRVTIGAQTVSDEWRHHVYRQELISTTHAFDCKPKRADDSGRAANIRLGETIVREQRNTGFATSYVLDTGTLTDGSAVVIETNNFFASGIYTTQAIRAIAEAIAEGCHE